MARMLDLYRRNGDHAGTLVVDDADCEWASQFKWSVSAQGYAVRKHGGRKGELRLIHRELLGLTKGDGVVTDHINGNRLDNRRENLRAGDYKLNGQNCSSRGKTSKYRGVDRVKQGWRAQATLDGRNRYLGVYPTEEEAARVAHEYRLEHMPGYVVR